jgi:hypothetical protein
VFSYPHEAEWTPFQIHYISEHLIAPGIELGTSGSVARNCDHWTTEALTKLILFMIVAPGHNIFVNFIQFSGENTSQKHILSLGR